MVPWRVPTNYEGRRKHSLLNSSTSRYVNLPLSYRIVTELTSEANHVKKMFTWFERDLKMCQTWTESRKITGRALETTKTKTSFPFFFLAICVLRLPCFLTRKVWCKMARDFENSSSRRDRSPSPRHEHRRTRYPRSKSRSKSRSRSRSRERSGSRERFRYVHCYLIYSLTYHSQFLQILCESYSNL